MATDPDAGQRLTYSLDVAPTGASIDPQTGLFTWIPNDGPADAQVVVRVTDSGSPVLSDTKSFTITVNNVAPTATLSNDGPVAYGSPVTVRFTDPSDPSSTDTAAGFHYAFALAPANLDAITYATAGTSDSAGFSLPAGLYTVYARILDKDGGFTPYRTTFTIDKADQVIHWDPPASILFGTPLGPDQLNATVTVPGPDPAAGALTYDPAASTVLPVGVHTLTVTAAESPNYKAATASVLLEVIPPASLSGLVFEDFNDDGEVDFGEHGLGGVLITLTGTDDLGHAVSLSQQTDGDGTYAFRTLRPGNYTISETQPAGYAQGINSVGTVGGTTASDQFFIDLGKGVAGLNYNFGERPSATGAVQHGQTAGIGFWNNKNGQALIKALNGRTGTQLGDWLAATFVNLFGVNAGANDLAGKDNAYVAAFFQKQFALKGSKLEAQVLATALSVYVTNATLDNTKVAAKYGFTVSGDGVGTSTFNVGSSGDAFGVANNTTMTVLDLLLATDAQALNGVLYGGNARKRDLANALYSALNEAGSIG